LEIGCAHGGFVAMLRQAGFDATGLELSPSIVGIAREAFGIPVLAGPIEDQAISPQSLDAIVIMDVLEHFPNPAATLGRCLQLLKPDGILLIQTPAYPEGASLGELRQQNSKFPEMLDKAEHLFLFSRSSVSRLLRELGAPYVEFAPAIFGFYDMFFVASRQALHSFDASERWAAMSQTVDGRFIQALLDLDDRRLNLLDKYRELRRAFPQAA